VIDVGGSGLKAACFDARGRRAGHALRVATPKPATRRLVVAALRSLALRLAPFRRVVVGFPGVVRHGRTWTAPNLAPGAWRGVPLEALLTRELGAPVQVVNDAVLQGHGVIRRKGVELVLTLGTGLGGALFVEGRPVPLEPGHVPWSERGTYEQQVGEAARRRLGTRAWRRRVVRAVRVFQALLQPDVVWVGGGNARWLPARPARGVRRAKNLAALRGGWRLSAAQRARNTK
jgi:polyphosphate glucokinase